MKYHIENNNTGKFMSRVIRIPCAEGSQMEIFSENIFLIQVFLTFLNEFSSEVDIDPS